LISYICAIVLRIIPGVVPGTSRCAAATIAVAAVSGRLIEATIAGAAITPTIAWRLHSRFLRRDLRSAIGLSCRAGWLHVWSVELARPSRRGYRRPAVIFRSKQLPVLAGGMFMLNLRR